MSGFAIGGLVVAAGSAAYGIYSSESAKKDAKKKARTQEMKDLYSTNLAKAEQRILKINLEKAKAKLKIQEQLTIEKKKEKGKIGILNTAIIGGSLLIGTVLSIFIIKKNKK